MTCFKRSIIFSLFCSLVHLCSNQCNAGLISNFNGFISDRVGNGKDRQSTDRVGSADSLDVIADLVSKNEVLTAQLSSLKTYIYVQKKQINEIRKEKEILRREMSKFRENQDNDREEIKNELRKAFEQEKNAILGSVEEDKKVMYEEHQLEIDEMKKALTRDIEIKNAEVETAVEITIMLKEKITELEIDQARNEKARLDASKDIADLKHELRIKEIASEKLRADDANAKTTSNITPSEPAVKSKKSLSNLDQKDDKSADSISISQNIHEKEVVSKKVSQEISHPPRRAKPSTTSSSKKSSSSNRLPLKGGSKSPSSQTGL